MADKKGLEHYLGDPSEKVTGGDGSKSDNLVARNFITSTTTTFDKKLLIDLRQLSIGNMLCQSRYSVVYQGLYKSRPVAIKVIQPERASNEETETEMTAEAGYTADALRYHSFSMVLWELLTNNTPFKGRSNILAAYATAKKVRPSMDDIPKEIEPLIRSRWSEDPADRPEFEKISEFLANTLGDDYTPQRITPNLSQRQPANAKITDILGISGWMVDAEAENKKKKSKCLLCCFTSMIILGIGAVAFVSLVPLCQFVYRSTLQNTFQSIVFS
ncbi:hypothetical protein HAX54_050574 [Datura stramonium]|uniref:Protein kinase domain-containing protein n=1 Tax=Datura stramonium TaxID=4076 RepID=A0ABS8SY90_DATST|nr:hypothetical protein [Datura stramonium]